MYINQTAVISVNYTTEGRTHSQVLWMR